MMLRSTMVMCAGLSVVALASGALACGGDKGDEDDQKDPSVLCGGGEDGDEGDEKEPSVLCDGDKDGDEGDEKEPSVL